MKKLVCWISPINGLAVIVSQSRLDEIIAIHEARTWGEFAKADPVTYQEVHKFYELQEEEFPSPSEPFEISMVPGFDEGDYPPWLQAEMGRYIPSDILRHHGHRDSSVLNGCYWAIKAEALQELIEALHERGFDVEQADALPFQ